MKQERIPFGSPEWKRYAQMVNQRGKRPSKPRVERADTGSPGPWEFVVMGKPAPKPRMTVGDRGRGRKRPRVSRYFTWCEEVKHAAPADLPPVCSKLHVIAYFPIPVSYPKRKREAIKGQPHELKPDASNILKGIEDALFLQDQRISRTSCSKFWDDGNGARVVITVER
jgi:Holliday junction resolvase RusA-like endonuclease